MLNSVVTVSIIGTAGRKEDGRKMSSDIFDYMMSTTEKIITETWKLPKSRVILVSGGSAWTDHVAVRLYLNCILSDCMEQYAGLKLFLPCNFYRLNRISAFEDKKGISFWKGNPGKTLNALHKSFSSKMNFKSLDDIMTVKAMGAELVTKYKGFHGRNLQVAKSDYLIAFTWSESNEQPKDGGTLYTWKECKSSHKLHCPLINRHTSELWEHDCCSDTNLLIGNSSCGKRNYSIFSDQSK